MTAPAADKQAVERELRASLAHDEWCNSMRRAGWRYGPALDLPGLQHPQIVAWDQLDADTCARYLAEVPE